MKRRSFISKMIATIAAPSISASGKRLWLAGETPPAIIGGIRSCSDLNAAFLAAEAKISHHLIKKRIQHGLDRQVFGSVETRNFSTLK